MPAEDNLQSGIKENWDKKLSLKNKAVIARGFHLLPFRTEKLSPSALMVLPHCGGRVGRRHFMKAFHWISEGLSSFKTVYKLLRRPTLQPTHKLRFVAVSSEAHSGLLVLRTSLAEPPLPVPEQREYNNTGYVFQNVLWILRSLKFLWRSDGHVSVD